MSVTEYRMRPGRWHVDLVDSTPNRLLDQIAVERFGFAQLVITPAWLDPRLIGDADMLSVARYTGVYRRQEARTRLAGAQVHVLLGDEDGKGDVMETVRSTPNGYLSQWYSELAYNGFVNPGAISVGGAYTGTFHRVTRREAWETLCAHFDVEWRVTPDLRFEVGPVSALYDTAPSLVVLRNAGWGGRDHRLSGMQGTAELTIDVEDFVTKIILLSGDRNAPTVTTATGAFPARTPLGTTLDMDMLLEDWETTSPAEQANARLQETNRPRYELRVSPDVYDPGRLAPVGAPVYVWDPTGGAVDPGNPVTFRGQTIFPMTARVEGVTWPVRAGMGVYLRRHTGSTVEWVDLTPYVQFETTAPTLDVGAIPRPSR